MSNQSDTSMDSQQEIKQAIKDFQLPLKLQCIALNFYLDKKKDLDDINQAQMVKVECQFRQKQLPSLNNISSIIQGKRQITQEQLIHCNFLLAEEERLNAKHYTNLQKMDCYWLKCLQNSDINLQILENDIPILQKLSNIQGILTQQGKEEMDGSKIQLKFQFEPNQWFTDSVLTKVVYFEDNQAQKSQAEKIHWKEGKNITVKKIKKKNKKKKAKQVQEPSFFNLFKEAVSGKNKQDELSDDPIIIQGQAVRTIYQQIIPKSLEYYLGVAELEDNLDMDEIDENQSQEDSDQIVKKKVHFYNQKPKKNRKKSSDSTEKNSNLQKKEQKGDQKQCKQQ